MKKLDPFFLIIIFIFFCLSTSYFAFDYHLSGVHVEKGKVALLEKQIQLLKLKTEALEIQAQNQKQTGGRQPASLRQGKEISLDFLYQSQLERAIALRKVTDIYSITDKILNHSVNSELLAHALYQKSVASCQIMFREDRCFTDIESLITQFPESKWAGESLVLLSGIYKKLKRFKEAESVLKIVKAEFPEQKDLLKRLAPQENTQL